MLGVWLPVAGAREKEGRLTSFCRLEQKRSLKPFAFAKPLSKEGLVIMATVYLRDSSDQLHCPSAAVPVTNAVVPTTGNTIWCI